jgi:hypothetical protein
MAPFLGARDQAISKGLSRIGRGETGLIKLVPQIIKQGEGIWFLRHARPFQKVFGLRNRSLDIGGNAIDPV